MAEGSDIVPDVSLRYVPNIDAYRIVDASLKPIRFKVGCIVKRHPYEYELIDDDVLENVRFTTFDGVVREKYKLGERSKILRVTPTQKPRLEITSERVIDGVFEGDTVALEIEVRHLRHQYHDYTISPIRVHVY